MTQASTVWNVLYRWTGQTPKEIARRTGLKGPSVRRAIQTLVKQGRARKTKDDFEGPGYVLRDV